MIEALDLSSGGAYIPKGHIVCETNCRKESLRNSMIYSSNMHGLNDPNCQEGNVHE